MTTNLKYLIVCAAFLFSIQFTYSQNPNDCMKPGNLSFNFFLDTIELGDTVPVDFVISGFKDITSFKFPITYNSFNMKFVSCEPQFLPNFTCDNIIPVQDYAADSSAPGQLIAFWIAEDISAPVSLDTEEVMFTLFFEVTGIGSSPDSIKIEDFSSFRFEFIKENLEDASSTFINDFCQDGGEFFVVCPEVTAFLSGCGGIADGSASFELTLCGGAAPFEYLIVSSTGEIIGTGNIPDNLTPLKIDGLDPGTTYNLEVRDVNGDLITTEEITLDVEEPINVDIDIANPRLSGSGTVPCAEGPQSFVRLEALVTPPGNYLYEWNGGRLGQELRSATPGDYSVTVQDIETGCEATTSYTLNQPEPIKINIDTLIGSVCTDSMALGSISLTISGGSPNFGEPGSYEVTFEDPVSGIAQRRASRSDGTINYSIQNYALPGSEWSIIVDDYAFGFQGVCPSLVTVFTVPDCITMSVENEEPEDKEPEEMESETPFLDSYPWLDSEISVDDCASLQITEYDLGAFSFIYLSDGRLYFQDGTFYCQSSDSRDCLALYELTETRVTTVWDCGEEGENQNENENQNGSENENENENGLPVNEYPWIDDAASGFDCGALGIQEYDLGAFSFVFLQDDDQAVLYFEDGTFYCQNSATMDCRALYNLDETILSNQWACEGENTTEENQDPSLYTDYPWLQNVLSMNCSSGMITEYALGAFHYILVESESGSALYFQDGTFYCTQTETYSCVTAYGLTEVNRAFSCSDLVDDSSELRDLQTNRIEDVSIYPNPSYDKFQLNYAGNLTQATIVDVSGRIIMTLPINKSKSGTKTIDLSQEKSGLYLLQLIIDEKVVSKKLIKL